MLTLLSLKNYPNNASHMILWRDVGYFVVHVRQIAVTNVKRFMKYKGLFIATGSLSGLESRVCC